MKKCEKTSARTKDANSVYVWLQINVDIEIDTAAVPNAMNFKKLENKNISETSVPFSIQLLIRPISWNYVILYAYRAYFI